MNTQTILNALNWRYAVRSFDTEKKIPQEELNTLFEVLRLAPSSYGIQPWKFFVVSNMDTRKKIQEAAWNQGQITQSSHLIVLARNADFTKTDTNTYIESVSETRHIPREKLKGFEDMINGTLNSLNLEQKGTWMAKQVYIALGFLLESAALLGIDAAPMEGFDPKAVDEILGLPDMGYRSVVLCCLGYRAKEDMMSGAPKVRKPLSVVVQELE